VRELLEVRGGQGREVSCAAAGQVQTDNSVVGRIGVARHQPGQLGTVDEPHHAVVTQQQVIGDITDGGGAAGMPANCEEQLILRGRDAGVDGLLFAPVQEAPELVAKGQEPLVIRV